MSLTAFDAACDALEQHSSLDRLQARGTIRLALKEAGLDARVVTAAQLEVVVEKILPTGLASRGVDAPASVCDAIRRALRSVASEGAGDTPDAIFARLGGG